MRAERLRVHGNTGSMPHHDEAVTGPVNGRSAVRDAEYPVLAPPAVVAHAQAGPLIELIRIKLGFPPETFASAVRPAIEGYAGFVQLLPVAGSVHHRRAGGRFLHGLELTLRALDHRRGRILPRGALPEVIGAHAHRWSYAVFVAALLHGAVDTVTGLRVLMRLPAEGFRGWDPLAGNLIALGATAYQVAVEHEGPHGDSRYRVLPARVYRACVPAAVRAWLAEEPILMRELEAWLSGDGCMPGGALADLVASAVAGPRRTRGACLDERTPAQDPVAAQQAAVEPAAPVAEDSEQTAESTRCRESEPTEAASVFVAWLKTGMAEGTIRVNEPGALVHGVAEGLLLVSPRIFRAFARACERDCDGSAGPSGNEADRGKRVQREVLRAGWHLQEAGGVNLLAYEVRQRDRAVSKLFGVVIREPARFLAPPPVNPALRRASAPDG